MTLGRARVKPQALLVFNQELLALIKAGLPILTALDLLGERTQQPHLRAVLAEAREAVKGGAALSAALALHPRIFSPLYTGALQDANHGGPDGCERAGQWIPFMKTKAERLTAGDPRHSLQERYKDHAGYVKEVTKAAEKLEKRRLLLPADVQKYIDEAQASDVLLP